MVSLLPSLPWPFSSRPNSAPTDPETLNQSTVRQPTNHDGRTATGKKEEAEKGAESVAKYLALLEPFAKEAGGALPTGARAAPEIAQASEGGLTWKLWQALPFFTGQG